MYFCQLNSLHIIIAVSMGRLSVWVTEWLWSSSGTTGPPSTFQSAHIILCPYVKLMQTSRLYSPCVCVCARVRMCSVVSDSSQAHGLYIVHQAWLSMGFPRQEYWSRLPFPSPGDLPNPGTETASPASASDSFFFFWPKVNSRFINKTGNPFLYHLGNLYVCYA